MEKFKNHRKTVNFIGRQGLKFIFFISTLVVLSYGQNPMEVLENIDKHRGIQNQSFSMHIRVQSFQGDVERQEVTLVSYVDNESEPNNWNTLIRMLSPKQRRGQLFLLEGDRMWFYKLGNRRPIRISPAQRLMGEASNGDVAGMNFREYYSIVSMEMDKVGKSDAYLIKLKKKKTSSPYEIVHLWGSQKNHLPIKAIFFSRSGRKLKTSFYRKFKKILGTLRATEIVIVDGINAKNVTHIIIEKMEKESLPNSYYRSEQLKTIQF